MESSGEDTSSSELSATAVPKETNLQDSTARISRPASPSGDDPKKRGEQTKRRTGANDHLIKKRHRRKPPPSVEETTERKMPPPSAAQQRGESRTSVNTNPMYSHSSAGLRQGNHPGIPAIGRGSYAEPPRSLLVDGQAMHPTERLLATGISDPFFASLSASDRQLLLQDQIVRNHQTAMLLAQLGGAHPFGESGLRTQHLPIPDSHSGSQFMRQGIPLDLMQRSSSGPLSLPTLRQLEYWRNAAGGAGFSGGSLVDQYRQQLLQQQQQQQQQQLSLDHQQQRRRNSPPVRREISTERIASLPGRPQSDSSRGDSKTDSENVDLPPCTEGPIPAVALRRAFPLGIDEDTNWLSEFHCFIRAELIEVFQASHEDVKGRNNTIAHKQIGLRCRYCAHRAGSARAGRSSAFPSSIRQIYQSFTMMLRDHFPNCDAITGEVRDRYILLKDRPSQGATDSKRYWIYSGLKIGMSDSKDGIYMTKETRLEGLASLPFGIDPNTPWRDDVYVDVSLVTPSDKEAISEFLFLLMSQVQPVRLTEAECIGNRRSLRVGLPGFGCRYCCQQRRLGLCRMFPARRRTLPTKIFDFYDHIRRCPLCPSMLKVGLITSKRQLGDQPIADQGPDREFFDRVWTRLGHDTPHT